MWDAYFSLVLALVILSINIGYFSYNALMMSVDFYRHIGLYCFLLAVPASFIGCVVAGIFVHFSLIPNSQKRVKEVKCL